MSSTSVRSAGVVTTGYMPSLDGWRALAVLGVMMAHDRPWTLFGYSSIHYKDFGGTGVDVFFAISGLLITSRILEEEKLCGRFDLRRFYIRRLCRIQPAALAYLAAIALLMLFGLAHQFGMLETPATWMAAVLLCTNFVYHPGDIPSLTGHFWTLAVEEHFYILLSLLLLMVKRWRAGVLAMLLVVFFLLPHLASTWAASSPRATQWHLGGLLLASLAAVMLGWRTSQALAVRVLRPWIVFLATPMLMLVRANLGSLRAHAGLVGLSALPKEVSFAVFHLTIFWLVATVYHPRSLTTRLLETSGFRLAGKISYSLYLWHVLVNYLWNFLGSTGVGPITHIENHWLRMLAERPSRYATAFAMAWLCYRYIEKPMIRLGHRLAPAATPGRLELADLPVEMRDARFTV